MGHWEHKQAGAARDQSAGSGLDWTMDNTGKLLVAQLVRL